LILSLCACFWISCVLHREAKSPVATGRDGRTPQLRNPKQGPKRQQRPKPNCLQRKWRMKSSAHETKANLIVYLCGRFDDDFLVNRMVSIPLQSFGRGTDVHNFIPDYLHDLANANNECRGGQVIQGRGAKWLCEQPSLTKYGS
jgi:hypothetical protein